MIINAFLFKKSACVGKNPDRGRASLTISEYSFKSLYYRCTPNMYVAKGPLLYKPEKSN